MIDSLHLYLSTSAKLFYPFFVQSHIPTPTLTLTHSLTCFQAFSEFIAYLDKLAGAIHPLLDAPPIDIPGVTAGSLRKRLAAAKTLRPIIKCGEFLGVHLANKRTHSVTRVVFCGNQVITSCVFQF